MKKINVLLATVSLFAITSSLPLYAQLDTPEQDMQACNEQNCDDEIRSLHSMARHGSFDAMTLLSMVYATGDGREADPEKALSFLERAVNHDHPMAVFLFSEWHRQGVVVAQDLQQADKFLTEAVKLEYPPAQYKKALQLLQQPDENNIAEGLSLLEKASDKRLFDAMFLLARLKQQGAFTAVDLEGAAQLFKNLVLSGHQESRPYLQETIAMLESIPAAAELVADLQQSYDIEVIKVVGHDFKPETMLTNVVKQLRRRGDYTSGSMQKIHNSACYNGQDCMRVVRTRVDKDLVQMLTGRP